MNPKEQIVLKNELALIDAFFDGINLANKQEARLEIRDIILEWRSKRNEIIDTFGLSEPNDDNGHTTWKPPACYKDIMAASTPEEVVMASGVVMECDVKRPSTRDGENGKVKD